MSVIDDLIAGMTRYNKNPASVQQASLDVLESILDGNDLPDPTNPFVFLLEASATGTAVAMSSSEAISRKMYKNLANKQSDLYHHMSDRDYLGRWSTPSTATVKFLLPRAQIVENAVGNNVNDIRSIIIPRDSYWTVNGATLGTHYPIQIDVLVSGAIQVFYIETPSSPLRTLTTNIVDSKTVKIQNTVYLELSIPMEEFSIDSTNYPVEGTSSFKQVIPFQNNFLYVRAYMDNGNNEWEEILTTHSLQVYDITKPTLVLEVFDGNVYASLPDIYYNTNLVGSAIRIDVYSTQGPLDIDLTEVPSSKYTFRWRDLDTFSSNIYSVPLDAISDSLMYSDGSITGGTDELSLEELRERVIYGVGSSRAPITPGEVEIGLKIKGYNVVRYIDNVTDRLFVASKALPLREREDLLAPVKASNSMVLFDETDPGYSRSVINNSVSSRATTLPDALYRFDGDECLLLNDAELTNLEQMSVEDRVAAYKENDYYYTPFHYVMDYGIGTFKVRPYLLTDPTIPGRTFEMDNRNIDYNINTKTIDVALVGNKYVITLVAAIPPGNPGPYHAQLFYRDPSNDTRGHISVQASTVNNATATFIFELETTFDITEDDYLEFSNFNLPSGGVGSLYTDLDTTFQLFYFVEGNPTGLGNDFSDLYEDPTVNPYIGATYETISVRFGRLMRRLYVPNRSTIGAPTLLRYTQDVPAVYDKDVYEVDSNGFRVVTVVGGVPTFNLLHSAGDPIMTNAFPPKPVMAHLEGDYVLDVSGKAQVAASGAIRRHIGITLVNAIYREATTPDIQEYFESIPGLIANYLENEIAPAALLLSERTRLHYKPRGSVSKVRVQLGGGVGRMVDPTLEFKVVYYLTEVGFANSELREKLDINVRKVISDAIKGTTISASQLETKLAALGGNNVIAVEVERFGDDKDIPIMTLEDKGTAFSVREELVILPDGNVDVRDTIDISYVTNVQ